MIISPQFITDFGDSAVTGTVAVVLAIAFFLTRNKPAAWAMLLAFGISASLIGIVKIAFYTCWLASPVGLHSPSGHAAVSTAVYGTLILIVVSPLKTWYRVPAYFLTAVFIVSIAVTRVILGRHTVAEVVTGLAGGGAVCGAVWQLCLRGRLVNINYIVVIPITIVAVIVIHGIQLPAESLINSITAYIGHLGHGCVK